MVDKYQLDGHDISLNTGDTLGNGGQAVVVKHQDQAIKIWKTIERDQVQKVEYLLRNKPKLPDTFLFPISRLTKNGALCGYGMGLLPPNYLEAGVLFNRTLRRDLKIGTPTLLSIINSARSDLDLAHKQNIVVGDVSGRNIAFVVTRNGIKTFCYDTDSWQIGGYRCPVWTEFFLCPDLYAQVQTGKVNFTEDSDWYSFNTILFWSLFNVNPYSQIHPHHPEFHDRARNGLWLFSPGVNYPKLCPHPDTIGDDLLHHFETVFAKHKYLPLTTEEINKYQKSLIECPSCGTFYPNTRKACPSCSIKTQAADFKPALFYDNMINSTGHIIFSKFQGGTLYAISQEKTGLFLWIRPPTTPAVKTAINYDPGQSAVRYDIVGGEYLAINTDNSDMVYLTPISSPGSSWITSSTSVYLGNRKAAFRGTSEGLLRLTGSALLLGKVQNGFLIDETLPADLANNQTWFWSDQTGQKILTISRFFSVYQFQLVNKKNRFEVNITKLLDSDSLQDITVHFGSDTICIRRTIYRKGRLLVITDIVNLFGQVVFNSTISATAFPGNNFHSVGFEDNKIFWPTDKGITVEDVLKGTFTEVPHTERIVDSQDKLIHLGGSKHFLVVREHQINYLKL